jgi:hypothetical protein
MTPLATLAGSVLVVELNRRSPPADTTDTTDTHAHTCAAVNAVCQGTDQSRSVRY